jgi:hypothetical protein
MFAVSWPLDLIWVKAFSLHASKHAGRSGPFVVKAATSDR